MQSGLDSFSCGARRSISLYIFPNSGELGATTFCDMLRSMMTISGFTLISRVLGLVRDQITGIIIGPCAASDAFFSAFRFPNMGRRIFGEGAFNSAFVPIYGQTVEQEEKYEADQFASLAFSWLVAILGVSSLVIIGGMKWFMAFFVPGFLDGFGEMTSWGLEGLQNGRTWKWIGSQIVNPTGGEKFEHTVEMGRIMFCYLLCMALGAQLSGVLNTWKKFAIAAFAPVLLNVLLLLGFVWIWFNDIEQQRQMTMVLSWCIFVAGWAQMGVLFYGVKRQGIQIRLTMPRLTPKMRQLFSLMVPGVAAASVQQINLLIGTQIASTHENAISYLYYADRLNQFPLGMIGIALGVSLLPTISRQVGAQDWDAARESLGNGIKIALLLTIPAAIALGVIPYDLIKATLGYGNYSDESVVETAKVLCAFALGLPAYVLIRVLQAGFFAQKDTKRPMQYGIVMVVVNIVLSFLLFPSMKHVGLGIATSVAGWVNVILLFLGLRGFFHVSPALLAKLARVVGASVAMALILLPASHFCADWISGAVIQRVCALGVIITGGLVVYAIASILLKATSLAELKSYMRRAS